MAEEADVGTVSLTVKTSALDNPTETVVTLPLSSTVYELKTKIETALGDHPPPNEQKLIFAGRLLDDQRLLSDVFCEQDLKLKLTVHLLIRKHISKPETFGGGTMVPRRESVGNSLAKAAVSPSSEVAPDDAPTTPQKVATSNLLEGSPGSVISSRLSLSPESVSSVPARDTTPGVGPSVSPAHPIDKPHTATTPSEEKSKHFAFPASVPAPEKSIARSDNEGKFKFPDAHIVAKPTETSATTAGNGTKTSSTSTVARTEEPEEKDRTPKREVSAKEKAPASPSPAGNKSSPVQSTSAIPRPEKTAPAVAPVLVTNTSSAQASPQVLASMQRVIEAQRALNAAREQYVEQQVELRRQMLSSNRMSPAAAFSQMPMSPAGMPMSPGVPAPFMVSPQWNLPAYPMPSPDLRRRSSVPGSATADTGQTESGGGGTIDQVPTGQQTSGNVTGAAVNAAPAAAPPRRQDVPPVPIANPPARRWIDGRALVMAAKLAFLLFLLGQHRNGTRDVYTLVGAGVVIFLIYLGILDWILNSRFVTSMFTHLDIRPRMVAFDENGRPIPEQEGREDGNRGGAHSSGGANNGNDDEWIEVDQDGNEVNPADTAPAEPPRILRPVRQAGIFKEVEVLIVGFFMSLFPSWDPPE